MQAFSACLCLLPRRVQIIQAEIQIHGRGCRPLRATRVTERWLAGRIIDQDLAGSTAKAGGRQSPPAASPFSRSSAVPLPAPTARLSGLTRATTYRGRPRAAPIERCHGDSRESGRGTPLTAQEAFRYCQAHYLQVEIRFIQQGACHS